MKPCTTISQGKYKMNYMLCIQFKSETNSYYKKEVNNKKTIIYICSSHIMKAVNAKLTKPLVTRLLKGFTVMCLLQW